MKARCLGTAVLALALLLAVAPVALAKGASAATIKGPGLHRPISLRGLGEPGADTKLAKLSDQAGLFVAMFGDNGVAGQLAGAPLWGGQQVVGGWFRGPSTLLPMLVSLGLPSKAPVAEAVASTAAAALTVRATRRRRSGPGRGR